MGLPMVIVGGWMAGNPGTLPVAPFVIALGLIGGGLLLPQRSTREIKRIVWAGFLLSVLLGIGAWQQWRDHSLMGTMAIGFAAAMVLSSLTAGLPKQSLIGGLIAVRGIAIASAAYAVIQVVQGAPRALGFLSLNPNALAGFLTITGMHWLIAGRGSRSSIAGASLILAGVPMAGSRWAMLVLGVAMVVLVAKRMVLDRSALVAAGVLLLMGLCVLAGVGRMEYLGEFSHLSDALARQQLTVLPSFIPAGFLGPLLEDGGHNAFLRVAVEAGWVGLVVFMGVLVIAYVRASNTVRPVIALLVVLGLMDYYVWGPFQLAPLLWAYAGLGVHGE